MTVITKPISENKVEKPLEKPLVVNDGVGVECVEVGCDRLSVDGSSGHLPHGGHHDPEMDLWTWAAGAGGSARRRRVSATTTVCVFVATLVLLTGAIIGGVYMYRQFTHIQTPHFRGWCGVPFKRDSLRLFRRQPMSVAQQSSSSRWPAGFTASDGIFNEQFDLDLGTESHEEIYVPDFGLGREGKFLHDFKEEKTVIVDTKDKRCFMFPLDRNLVATPRAMFRIFRKMWRGGFYKGNMVVIRQTMRVVRPPVQDLSDAGELIARICGDFTTYRLEKLNQGTDERMKRDANSSEDTGDHQDPDDDDDDDNTKEPESEEVGGVLEQQDQEPEQQTLDQVATLATKAVEVQEDQAVADQTPYEQSRSHFTVAEFAGKAIVVFTILDE